MPPARPNPPPGCKPQPLADPLGDRKVHDLLPPPAQLLTADALFNKKGIPDLTLLVRHLQLEGFLSQELLLDVIKMASDHFESEPNMLKLTDPITVVGDLHGQFFDLVKLLEVGGKPGETQYLFLGDYVDRGSFSIEVLVLLFATKIKFPKQIRMLRGNHECRQMTAYFNFKEECEYKYDRSVYDAFMDSFDLLPIAATINQKFIAVHGGLSPELVSVKNLHSINRFQEPPRDGLLCDLLWSDPLDSKSGQVTSKKKACHFVKNDVRGCSYFFSFDCAMRFLQKNSLLSVIRAHEVQLEGFKMHQTNPQSGFPTVITIFSAPNYCDVYNNKGAVLKFDNSTLNILQFNCSPHPYHLPNFMDVFAWSIPFVIEKVMEMLYFLVQPVGKNDEDEEKDMPAVTVKSNAYRESLTVPQNKAVLLANALSNQTASESSSGSSGGGTIEEDRQRIRRKVMAVGRMARLFKTLRQENEVVLKLKGVCPGHKLKPGLLLAGKEQLSDELSQYERVCDIDLVNEKRPDADPPPSPCRRSSIMECEGINEATESECGEKEGGEEPLLRAESIVVVRDVDGCGMAKKVSGTRSGC